MAVWPGVWLLISGLWLWNLRAQGQVSRLREERQREAHLAAVGQMTARLAHEIKNPLGAIRGAAQHLLGGLAATDPSRALLQVVEEETHRLEELTRGILDFSRPVQIRPEHQPPGPILRDALDRFATLQRRPPILLDLPPTLPDMSLDGSALRQILENLLGNAFDACPDGPVGCSVVVTERSLIVRVSDRGPGLAQEVQERLFEPFVSTKPRGYGLGLANSRRLAEAHGGTLFLKDQPGGGCLAELELPLEGNHARVT
jgi:signal transduction histidine kinase